MHEAEPTQHRPRADVAGLDGRLDSVQAHPVRRRCEGQVDDEPQPFPEEAAPGIRVEGVVAEVSAEEPAADHSSDVDHADEGVVAVRVPGVDQERPVIRRLRLQTRRQGVRVDGVPRRHASAGLHDRPLVCRDVTVRRARHPHPLVVGAERPQLGRHPTCAPRRMMALGDPSTLRSRRGSFS